MTKLIWEIVVIVLFLFLFRKPLWSALRVINSKNRDVWMAKKEWEEWPIRLAHYSKRYVDALEEDFEAILEYDKISRGDFENDDAYRKRQEELLEQPQKAQEKYKKALEEYEKIEKEAQEAREKYEKLVVQDQLEEK